MLDYIKREAKRQANKAFAKTAHYLLDNHGKDLYNVLYKSNRLANKYLTPQQKKIIMKGMSNVLTSKHTHLPTNFRILVRSILDPERGVTNSDIYSSEQNTLDELYKTSKRRQIEQMVNKQGWLNKYKWMTDAAKRMGKYDILLKDMFGNGIQFADMIIHGEEKDKRANPPIVTDSLANIVKHSFTDPYYNMRTTIGRGNISYDNYNRPHIKEKYDFMKFAPGAQDETEDYYWLHRIGEDFSKPINVDIQLLNKR